MHKGKNKMMNNSEAKNKDLEISEDFLNPGEYFFKEQDGREAVTIKAKSMSEALEIYNQK